ncbi:MAG: hypothetical protein ACE5IJ_10400 [Thermoplasmata archaeon]
MRRMEMGLRDGGRIRMSQMLGVAFGSGITALLLFLPSTGLMPFPMGSLAPVLGLILVVPGVLVAGLFAHSSRRGALSGVMTLPAPYLAFVAYGLVMIRVPIELVVFYGLLLVGVALLSGSATGAYRKTTI